MRLLCAALLLTVAAPLAGADDPKEAAKKLEGTYEVVNIFIAGKADPKKDAIKSVEIKDDQIVIKMAKLDDPARFTLDPSKTPARIDLTISIVGDEKVPGIYETKETDKGLELTITFRLNPKADRPTDFKGEGKEDVVLKLLRKKEKP